MAKKSKKGSKRERREQDAVDREVAEREARKLQRIWRAVIVAIPLLTVVAALATWAATDDVRIGALVGLLGVGLWVPALLGSIGASVRPRDRTRAGSIDFGQRR